MPGVGERIWGRKGGKRKDLDCGWRLLACKSEFVIGAPGLVPIQERNSGKGEMVNPDLETTLVHIPFHIFDSKFRLLKLFDAFKDIRMLRGGLSS